MTDRADAIRATRPLRAEAPMGDAVMAVADAETAQLRQQLADTEERARKAERAVNLPADAHRRAERDETAIDTDGSRS